MATKMLQNSDLLNYILQRQCQPGEQVPPLDKLSKEMNISIGKLREQLEVAQAMGFVEVRPRTGVRLKPYTFAPAVRYSLLFAIATNHRYFQDFSELRNHVEFAFFHKAVALLTAEDHAYLRTLISRAWSKLDENPPRIPHAEHRELHLTIFRRLDNVFVRGLLEAYWDAYEAEGLNVMSEYEYQREVWTHHQGIVEAIIRSDVDEAYRLLVQHTQLLQKHPATRKGEALLQQPVGDAEAAVNQPSVTPPPLSLEAVPDRAATSQPE
ncbi:MAG: FadR/GntR family transcriptional regulator [Thermoflexales bacterium]